MSDDYFEQNKRSGINRGVDSSPASQEKWFATLDHENRSQVLDRYTAEDAANADQHLSLEEAGSGLERRSHVARLQQIHAALRRNGR
ncbi:hypothetical protein ACVINW_006336 [Bradyrhizobium sp. USDA 4461]